MAGGATISGVMVDLFATAEQSPGRHRKGGPGQHQLSMRTPAAKMWPIVGEYG
jgi:hypothetical protein